MLYSILYTRTRQANPVAHTKHPHLKHGRYDRVRMFVCVWANSRCCHLQFEHSWILLLNIATLIFKSTIFALLLLLTYYTWDAVDTLIAFMLLYLYTSFRVIKFDSNDIIVDATKRHFVWQQIAIRFLQLQCKSFLEYNQLNGFRHVSIDFFRRHKRYRYIRLF